MQFSGIAPQLDAVCLLAPAVSVREVQLPSLYQVPVAAVTNDTVLTP